MGLEFGKWLLDVAKYMLTALLFANFFGDMDSPSALVFAILVMVILFGAGLVLVYDYGNHKDKGINKKKGK